MVSDNTTSYSSVVALMAKERMAKKSDSKRSKIQKRGRILSRSCIRKLVIKYGSVMQKGKRIHVHLHDTSNGNDFHSVYNAVDQKCYGILERVMHNARIMANLEGLNTVLERHILKSISFTTGSDSIGLASQTYRKAV